MAIKSRVKDSEKGSSTRQERRRAVYEGIRRKIGTSPRYRANPIDSVIDRVSQIAQEAGVEIFPSTKGKVKFYLNRAIANNLIRDDHDLILGAAALITIGIEPAKERRKGGSRVKIADVNQGYRRIVRRVPDVYLGPGNHAPHNCLLRTVITREDDLRKEIPQLDRILNDFGE